VFSKCFIVKYIQPFYIDGVCFPCDVRKNKRRAGYGVPSSLLIDAADDDVRTDAVQCFRNGSWN